MSSHVYLHLVIDHDGTNLPQAPHIARMIEETLPSRLAEWDGQREPEATGLTVRAHVQSAAIWSGRIRPTLEELRAEGPSEADLAIRDAEAILALNRLERGEATFAAPDLAAGDHFAYPGDRGYWGNNEAWASMDRLARGGRRPRPSPSITPRSTDSFSSPARLSLSRGIAARAARFLARLRGASGERG